MSGKVIDGHCDVGSGAFVHFGLAAGRHFGTKAENEPLRSPPERQNCVRSADVTAKREAELRPFDLSEPT